MTDAAWQTLSPVIAALSPAPRTPADTLEPAHREVVIAAIAGQTTGFLARPEQISSPVTDVRQGAALSAQAQRLQPTQPTVQLVA